MVDVVDAVGCCGCHCCFDDRPVRVVRRWGTWKGERGFGEQTHDESPAGEENPRRHKPGCLEPMGRVPRIGPELEGGCCHGCCRSQSRGRSIAPAGPEERGWWDGSRAARRQGVAGVATGSSRGEEEMGERARGSERRTDAMDDVQQIDARAWQSFSGRATSKTQAKRLTSVVRRERPNRAVKAVALGEIQASRGNTRFGVALS